MIRKIMSYVQQYKKESIIAPVAMIGEVGMEVAIPARLRSRLPSMCPVDDQSL